MGQSMQSCPLSWTGCVEMAYSSLLRLDEVKIQKAIV